jgi:hypothetical protein
MAGGSTDAAQVPHTCGSGGVEGEQSGAPRSVEATRGLRLRLNRFLAPAGQGAPGVSLVGEGRIEISGLPPSPAFSVDPKDRVTCDGERIRPPRVRSAA